MIAHEFLSDFLGGCDAFLAVADGHDEDGEAGVEELLGGVVAETCVGAGHDCGLAGEVERGGDGWDGEDVLAVEEVEEGVFPTTHFGG